MPLTLILQFATAVLHMATGAAALAAVRRPGGFPARFRLTWRVAGWALLLMGINGVLQDVHGARAIAGGQGSAVWDGYMRWAPAWNHSREAVSFALAALLLACATARGRAWLERRGAAAAALAAAMAAGALGGWLEGTLDYDAHFSRIAVLDSAALLLLIAGVAAAMLADVVDRFLIVALVTYAVPLPLNALWFAWMTMSGDGGWRPSPSTMGMYRVLFAAAVCAVAVRRWRLARRGAYVPGLLGPPPATRPILG